MSMDDLERATKRDITGLQARALPFSSHIHRFTLDARRHWFPGE